MDTIKKAKKYRRKYLQIMYLVSVAYPEYIENSYIIQE